MTRATAWLRRGQRAQSMIEFALCAPICLALLVGGVETGNYVVNRMVAAQAVRQAVRLAAELGPDGCPRTTCDPSATDAKIVDRVLSITGLECAGGRYQPWPGTANGQGGLRDWELLGIDVANALGNEVNSYNPCTGIAGGTYPLSLRGNQPPNVGRITVTIHALYHPALSKAITFDITEHATMQIQQDI